MGLFGPRFKNDHFMFLALKKCHDVIFLLEHADHFVSRKEYQPILDETKKIFLDFETLERNRVLKTFCKENKIDYSLLLKFMSEYSHAREIIDKHNKEYVDKKLKEEARYLDFILEKENPSICLDLDQRKAILRDEDYTLIVAGAGAGKTTLIEGKCKYLIDKKNIDPKRILVVSFTRKATGELKERFKKLGLQCQIATFHALGNSLLYKESEEKHKIVERGYLIDCLTKFLKNDCKDEVFLSKLALFFASYLDVPINPDEAIETYKNILSRGGEITIKGNFEETLDLYKKRLEKARISFRSERVRSLEECRIANFLFINGIEYEYEAAYPYCFENSTKPYCPDFTLKQGDKVFYLEHYGIDENGNSTRYSPEQIKHYKDAIRSKAALHQKHNTKLIVTFSRYRDKRGLIEHLREELIKNGFHLNPKKNVEIYYQLAKTAEDRYFFRFVQLLANFINRFKVDDYAVEKFSDFKAIARNQNDERSLLFMDIAHQCYLAYQNSLEKDNAIDFEDMISKASRYLESLKKSGEKLPYDYIFIDEYQDISLQRFNLAKKFSEVSNAKIIAVGDDWQSIYRFSGSEISLFVDFEKTMGYCDLLYLHSTHRNSQELIDIAGKFVMRNDLQLKKDLISKKHCKDPVLIMSYEDKVHPGDQETPYYRLGLAIVDSLKRIHDEFGDTHNVLLIGRYNFDPYVLGKLTDLFEYDQRRKTVKSKQFPKIKIDFLTAHSSKGLGYDEVIVINAKDDILGFPSKIEDDPIMKFVIQEKPEIEYGEERRLFYVALTRTKNRVFLITPKNKPSEFVLELKKSKNVAILGPILGKREHNEIHYVCPKCGYPLQKRAPIKELRKTLPTVWICSNEPEQCGFVTNDINGGGLEIQKCPQCLSGYLIVKKIKDEENKDTGRRMLGCTNFHKDGSGCDFVLLRPTRSLEEVSRDEYIYRKHKLPIESCVLFSYQISTLIYATWEVIGYMQKNGCQPNKSTLISFLLGNPNNTILAFHLDGCRGYGFLKEKATERELDRYVDVLCSLQFLNVDLKNRYMHLSKGKTSLTEDSVRKVFEFFLKGKRKPKNNAK